MNQVDILRELNSEKNLKKLSELGELHILTKHYLLLAEELSEDGISFLQPLKEHRDAYDHFMRIFALPHRNEQEFGKNFDVVKYIEENVSKAYGHEYRAFFDTADWLTFICRKYIRQALSYHSIKKRYENDYKDYNDIKSIINDIPYKIAKYREQKDISDNNVIKEV